MKRSLYRDTTYGVVEDDLLGSWPHGYFMPVVLPRELSLTPDTLAAVDQAHLALGKLDGSASLLPPRVNILAPSLAQDALSSSRIEGTIASLSDVIASELSPSDVASEGVREVTNYMAALHRGVELIDTLPLTHRLFSEVHRVLLTGVRGSEKTPGELRTTPVWVGGPGVGPADARFIPPIPSRLPELITDWENYVNRGEGGSAVVRSALAHYQFETIHPFLDGNGRVGRVLIVLQLIADGIMSRALFGVSTYIDEHRSEYYERLQAVRERGDMDGWVRFFARAVSAEATIHAHRLATLTSLRQRYLADAAGARQSLVAFIDVLFRYPVITVSGVQAQLELSQPTAAKLIQDGEALGWLRSLGRSGRGGKQRWFAHEIWGATTNEPANG
jgi:Fic family protein